MPKVGTAVVHELHLPFVFRLSGDELDPIVPQRQPLNYPVVAGCPVVATSVEDERDLASGAPGTPFVPLGAHGLLEPGPLPLPPFRFAESEESAAPSSSSVMDETVDASNIKIPSDRWEASRGKDYRQTTRPGPPPNRL